MPVFFDAGLIILIPLAFSLAKRTKRSVLYLSLIHISHGIHRLSFA